MRLVREIIPPVSRDANFWKLDRVMYALAHGRVNTATVIAQQASINNERSLALGSSRTCLRWRTLLKAGLESVDARPMPKQCSAVGCHGNPGQSLAAASLGPKREATSASYAGRNSVCFLFRVCSDVRKTPPSSERL